MGLPLWNSVEKTVREVETDRLSSKEKVMGTELSKEGHADSIPEIGRIHHN